MTSVKDIMSKKGWFETSQGVSHLSYPVIFSGPKAWSNAFTFDSYMLGFCENVDKTTNTLMEAQKKYHAAMLFFIEETRLRWYEDLATMARAMDLSEV